MVTSIIRIQLFIADLRKEIHIVEHVSLTKERERSMKTTK